MTPNLAVADARDALRWYADVLGARPHSEPIVMPDGRIGHPELELAGGASSCWRTNIPSSASSRRAPARAPR